MESILQWEILNGHVLMLSRGSYPDFAFNVIIESPLAQEVHVFPFKCEEKAIREFNKFLFLIDQELWGLHKPEVWRDLAS